MDILKSEHKIFLILLKYIPFILSISYFVAVVLDIHGIDTMWLSILAGAGFIPSIFVLLLSYIFRYCIYHRMPIYYVMLNNFVNWLVYAYNFNMSICMYFSWFMFITAVFCIITTILYLNNKKKHVVATNNKKRISKNN